MNQTEKITEAKIFEGCKHPELIDQYIEGIKSGTKLRTLSAILTKIEELNYITYDRSDLSTGIAYDEDDLKSLIEEHLSQ